MAFTVAEMTDADLSEYVRIHAAAFANTLYKIIYTRPLSQASMRDYERQCREMRHEDPNIHFLKVTDEATGEIISCAKWIYCPPGRSAEEVEKALSELPEMLPESKPEAVKDLFGMMSREKGKIMGTRGYWGTCMNCPDCFFTNKSKLTFPIDLEALTTHPKHERRGAGRLLVNWGAEQAEQTGLECYVEASITGRPVYERCGFRSVQELPFDAPKHGVYDHEMLHVSL